MSNLTEGVYYIDVQCPHCARMVEIRCEIDGVLKVKAGEGTLSVACGAKAVPHQCGQGVLDGEQLEVDQETGEVLNAPEAVRGVRLV